MNPNPTPAEVGQALKEFSNYRCLRSQQLVHDMPHAPLPASVMMGLGLRESGLKNICGGAIFVEGKWVQSFSDRGCFQISDKIDRDWLASVPGCSNGNWLPQEGFSALEPMHCPRFTDAAKRVLYVAQLNHNQGLKAGVDDSEIVRFTVACHNAGFHGALEGWKAGNVDLHTTHQDYSAWVMRQSYVIHKWIMDHPNWRYTGQVFGEEAP